MVSATEYPMNRDELALQFKSEVSNRAEEVDPEDERDWYALTLGWALAKGLAPAAAHEFARYIRYQTDLA